MRARADSFASRVVGAGARPTRPWLRVTVSPRVARFLVAAGACPALAQRGENLRNARLPGADLARADLRGADLTRADLGGANLLSANLTDTDVRGADLTGANLGGAILAGADLAART